MSNITVEMLRIANQYDACLLGYDLAIIRLQSLGLTEVQADRLLFSKLNGGEGTLSEVWQ